MTLPDSNPSYRPKASEAASPQDCDPVGTGPSSRPGVPSASELSLADGNPSKRLIADERDQLREALQRIADGAESNPPHEVAAIAREALRVTDQEPKP